MVETGGGAAFPVVFFDGEKEIDIGDIWITPALEYETFQLMLSEKIGISRNQISIYLVDMKSNPQSTLLEDRRKILITGKVNFGLLCDQEKYCFLVVLNRSKNSKNPEQKTINGVNSSVRRNRVIPSDSEAKKDFCYQCCNAKKNGETASFHPCVNDTVITRFTTRFGPISRANKFLP